MMLPNLFLCSVCFLFWPAILLCQSDSPSTTVSSVSSETSVTSPSVPTINVDSDVDGPLRATAWALIYTYPLYIFANWVGNVLKTGSVNEIYHQRNLASPDSPGVIKPNVDTLYSRVVLDLSQHDVVLTVPNITDGRYWNFPVYDPYGNDVADIGIVNGNEPGQYLIRRADDISVAAGYQDTSDPDSSLSGQYKGIVNLPTSYGTMLIRLLVLQNTTEDLQTLHEYQNASKLEAVPRQSNTQKDLATTPELTSLAPNGTFLGIDTPAKLLSLSAKLIPYAQPENITDRYRVATILARAGLYDNQYHPQSSVSLTFASAIANASITADIEDPAHIRPQTSEWQLSITSYQGNFGTHYAPRAYIAVAGYQQLPVQQVLYPGWKNIGFTSAISLEPNTSVLFSFSKKPQLKAAGFWSLTVYGADQYLIPNELNVFEAGDRSHNITYQGTQCELGYGPESNATQDGPFQILVQDLNTPPPSNWTGNWIPAAQEFSFILRWYVPDDAMTNGTYVYPVVETVPSVIQ